SQRPRVLPGQAARNPSDLELYIEGIVEAPRGPRDLSPNKTYVPAFKLDAPFCESMGPCDNSKLWCKDGCGFGDKGCGAGCGTGCGPCGNGPMVYNVPMQGAAMQGAAMQVMPAQPALPMNTQMMPAEPRKGLLQSSGSMSSEG